MRPAAPLRSITENSVSFPSISPHWCIPSSSSPSSSSFLPQPILSYRSLSFVFISPPSSLRVLLAHDPTCLRLYVCTHSHLFRFRFRFRFFFVYLLRPIFSSYIID